MVGRMEAAEPGSRGTMKKHFLNFPCKLCAISTISFAVQAVADLRGDAAQLRISYSSTSGRATFVQSAGTEGIPVEAEGGTPVARDFLSQYGEYFGVADADAELVQLSENQDLLGHRHVKFQQVFNGVEVFGGVLKVHQDDQLRFTGANGRFHSIKADLDTAPALTGAEAAVIAMQKSGSVGALLESANLVVVDPGWYGDASIGAHLAWYVIVANGAEYYREAFFIDAKTGWLLDRWSLIQHAQNRRVYDANGGTALPGFPVRSEGDPPTGDPDADAAYDYASDVYGYYWRAFGRDGLDDAGGTLISSVHSNSAPCPNAFWTGFQSVFCDGVASDDIVAHEFQHGVTQHTANLIYQNQPGQINEALSDIFGELIDLHNGNVRFVGPAAPPFWPPHPTGPGTDQSNNLRSSACSEAPGYSDGVRWLIAEDGLSFPQAIRDMWNPTCRNHPDRANSPLQTCDETDNGGVHSGSGVVNHAFAMMVDGKFFNGRTVPAIGPIKAGAVWYRALTTYLTVASDFEDLAVALNQAAADLIGTFPNDPATGFPIGNAFTGSDAAAVNQAVLAAELNTPGRCGAAVALLDPAPPHACPGATVMLQDDFENGINGWTTQISGPSGPPTPYTWVQRSDDLPMGHSGTVWYCADPTLGNCTSQNESAVHSLITPPIPMASSLTFPRLSFAHYMASEPTYDGGNVSIRVNDGTWQLIPFDAFEYNSYSAYLRPTVLGNSNPRAGQPAWTSAGGDWGTTIIDLGDFVSGGETIQLRFDFSKDGCNGIDGWYIDDVSVYDCPDCDDSLLPDNLDYVHTYVSGTMGPVGATSPQTATIENVARAAGPVTFRFDASADLGASSEYIDVFLNGNYVGSIFGEGASECSLWPNEAVVVLSASQFNFATSSGTAVISMLPSEDVAAASCGNGYINVSVRYSCEIDDDNHDGVIDACEDCQPNGVNDIDDLDSGASQDCNHNDRPDECDVASGSSPDENANGLPDECDCSVPPAPLPESNASCAGCYYPKNRYLSVVPPPVPDTAFSVAIRVRLSQLPGPSNCPKVADFSAYQGVEMWVGQQVLRHGLPTGVYELQSTPHFRDWTTVPGGVIHIADCNIVPCATYLVDAVTNVCSSFFDPFSPAISLSTTAVWADIVAGGGTTAPNNIVDFADISSAVDRFRSVPTAPHATRCDLGENRPSGGVLMPINFLDISYVVDAFRGGSYPFSGPSAPLPCPGVP